MYEITNMFSLFGALPLDWLILGGVVIVVALDSLRSGIGRAISISIALTLALVLRSFVEDTVILNSVEVLQTLSGQAVVFVVLAIVLFFIVRRMGLDYIDGGMGEPVQALLAGLATAVLFTCVWLEVPALSEWWTLNETIGSIFAEQFRMFWMLGAYAMLAFARG